MDRKERACILRLILLLVLLPPSFASTICEPGSSIPGISAEESPPPVIVQPASGRQTILVVHTTTIDRSIRRALQDLEYDFDMIYAPDTWTGIDFSVYDLVLFAVEGGNIRESSLAVVRQQVIDTGRRAIFLGGVASSAFARGMNQHLLSNRVDRYDWAISMSPHFSLQESLHRLARKLPAPHTYADEEAASYCLRVNDNAAVVVARNGDDFPILLHKGTYGEGSGDLLWFAAPPGETHWLDAYDFSFLRTILNNAILFGSDCPVLVVHTADVRWSVFESLYRFGFPYQAIFSSDWTELDFSSYETIFFALDGGNISLDSVSRIRSAVIEQGKRAVLLGGSATPEYVAAIDSCLLNNDLENYSWEISPPPHLTILNSNHFLTFGLESPITFIDQGAATFMLRITDPEIETVALNAASFPAISYRSDFENGGDLVTIIMSPLTSYWSQQEDRNILHRLLYNTVRCGETETCEIALISDTQELDTIESLLAGQGFETTAYQWNSEAFYTADPDVLSRYSTIVWYNYNRGITTDEYSALADWITAGGSLLVTGYDSLGSPDDPYLADLIHSCQYGDGPNTVKVLVTEESHPITNGPYGRWAAGSELQASHSDHDMAMADGSEGSRAVLSLDDGHAKILATQDIGYGGRVVYWNGNYELAEWRDGGTQPDFQLLFLNTIYWLCQDAPPVTPTPTPSPTPSPSPTPEPIPVLSGFGLLVLSLIVSFLLFHRK